MNNNKSLKTTPIKKHDVLLKLREARKEANLSLRELAQKAEVPYSHISIMERGLSNSKIETIERVANALNKKLEITLV